MKKNYDLLKSNILDASLNELKILLKNANEEVFDTLVSYYENENYDELYDFFFLSKKANRILKDKITTDNEKGAYQIGVLTATTHIFNQLLNKQLEEEKEEKELIILMQKKSAKKILIKLYEYNDIQNKVLIEEFGTYANEILKQLMDLKLIRKTPISKYSLYNLTSSGKKFVEKNLTTSIVDIKNKYTYSKITYEEKNNTEDTYKMDDDIYKYSLNNKWGV